MHLQTSGFVVRVRWSNDAQNTPHITLQNVSTKEVLTLSSWSALLEAMQQPPAPTTSVEKLD